MLTGFALPVSFNEMVQSIEPRCRFLERMVRISNSNGLRNAGIFRFSSNCFPLSDLMSMRKVLSPTAFSALPNPVIDFNILIDLWQGNDCMQCFFQTRYSTWLSG